MALVFTGMIWLQKGKGLLAETTKGSHDEVVCLQVATECGERAYTKSV